jgi:hypothetical protein
MERYDSGRSSVSEEDKQSWGETLKEGKVLFLILLALMFGGTVRELVAFGTGGLVKLPDSAESSAIECARRAPYEDTDEERTPGEILAALHACIPPAEKDG